MVYMLLNCDLIKIASPPTNPVVSSGLQRNTSFVDQYQKPINRPSSQYNSTLILGTFQ